MDDGSDEKLTLSDWISFLSSEGASTSGNTISLGAFVLAGVAILVTINKTANSDWGIAIGSGFIMVSMVWVWFFWKFGMKLGHHSAIAQYLLYKIMEGELRDPLEIEKKWKEYREDEKRSWEAIVKEKKAKKHRTAEKKG